MKGLSARAGPLRHKMMRIRISPSGTCQRSLPRRSKKRQPAARAREHGQARPGDGRRGTCSVSTRCGVSGDGTARGAETPDPADGSTPRHTRLTLASVPSIYRLRCQAPRDPHHPTERQQPTSWRGDHRGRPASWGGNGFPAGHHPAISVTAALAQPGIEVRCSHSTTSA